MKSQKLVNLGLSVGLSFIFINFLLTNKFFSLVGIGSAIGLLAELYYFFNMIFKQRVENG